MAIKRNNLWIRKTINGDDGLGLIPFLLLAVTVAGLFIWAFTVNNKPGLTFGLNKPHPPKVEIQSVADAATKFSDSAPQQTTLSAEEKSEKRVVTSTASPAPPEKSSSSFDDSEGLEKSTPNTDLVSALYHRALNKNTAPALPPVASHQNPSTMNYGGSESTSSNPQNTSQSVDKPLDITHESVVVYEDDTPEIQPATISAPQPLSGFQTNNFLPKGTEINVCFLEPFETINGELPVQLVVTENVIKWHKIQIPCAWTMFGTASTQMLQNRVLCNIDTLEDDQGRELPISGILLDSLNGGTGVKAYNIPPALWVQLLPQSQLLASAFFTGAQQIRDQQQVLTTAGGVSITSDTQVLRQNLQNSMLQGIGNIVNTTLSNYTASEQAQNAAYLRIPGGWPAKVYLRNAVDLSKFEVNGSSKNTMPILPGFENNPITASGQVSHHASLVPSGSAPTTYSNSPQPLKSMTTTNPNTPEQSAQPVAVPTATPSSNPYAAIDQKTQQTQTDNLP